jgi:hypothetical protein
MWYWGYAHYCFGGSPPKPKPPPEIEQALDTASQQGRDAFNKRRRSALSGNYNSAFTTAGGGAGVIGAANTGKSALGQ